jgi:hypothetical protein
MTTLITKYDQGSTGSINRPINLKLEESISILDFGADPTGTNDSTTAIQNAFNAGASSSVLVPPGTYKITTTITIPTGTTITFSGFNSLFKYYGSGPCLQVVSSKHITIYNLNIDITNGTASAIGIQYRGAWFMQLYQPTITCSKVGQAAIGIVTSDSANLGFGSFMFEIFNPYFNFGTYGIITDIATGDTVHNTHISVYDGWSNGVTYPLYYRHIDTFNIFNFTPENCIDGINLATCTSGTIHFGEIDATGYALNFSDNSCNGISVLLNSISGNNNSINTLYYTPTIYSLNGIRLNGSASGTNNNYNYAINTDFVYTQALLETAQGGGTLKTLRTFDDVNLQRLYNLKSISGTPTVGSNLRGNVTFSASTTTTVSFSTAEPDSSYFIALGGNAAGYCWVTNKTTTGFTINCSASNSNSTDWILIR